MATQCSNSTFSKTKMCKFNILGKCERGTDCQWAHHASELRAAPDLQCTRLCKQMQSQGHCETPNCTFAHSKEELRKINMNFNRRTAPPAEVPTAVPTLTATALGSLAMPSLTSREPESLNADAQLFVPSLAPEPMKGSATTPGSLPTTNDVIICRPPGLGDVGGPAYIPLSLSSGTWAWAWPEKNIGATCSTNDSESTCSSDGNGIDGDTPIADLIALSFSEQPRTSTNELLTSQMPSNKACCLAALQL